LENKLSHHISRKFLFLILAFFLTLNFATSGGHLYSEDDTRYFLHTENLFFNKSLKLDPFSPSAEVVSSENELKHLQKTSYWLNFQKKNLPEDTQLEPFHTWSPLLISFFTIPLYYISIITSTNAVTNLTFFTNSIILSLVALMIFLLSMHYFSSKKVSFTLSLVFLVTTWVWSYNTGMMFRPLSALLLILGFYYLVTSKTNGSYHPLMAGLFFGLTILSNYSALIILPGLTIFGIYKFRKNKKGIILFLISISIILFIQALLNEARYESYTSFGLGSLQDPAVHLKNYEGIIGYIFSIGWGVFFNAPLLLLFPVAIFLIMKKNRSLGFLLLYLFIVTWLFHGTERSVVWSGYGGWGPRYFTTILPLLIFSLGFVLQKYSNKKILKTAFAGFAIFGFFVSFIGKLVWYMYGYSYGWVVLKTEVIKNGWLLQNYDISYAPITQNLMFLFTNHVESFPSPYSHNIARGLAPCPVDFFIYCNIGILPFVVILISLCFIGFLILKILKKHSLFYSTH